MANLVRVYWDANAWLGLINGEPSKVAATEYIYNSARAGGHEIWTSTISFVEVYRLKDEKGTTKPYPSDGLDKIEEMFEQDFVKLIPVDFEVGKLARKLLREQAGLKKPSDAIHLASALRWSVDVLHTYDREDLLHLNGKLKTKKGDPLSIMHPEEPSDLPLFGRPKPTD